MDVGKGIVFYTAGEVADSILERVVSTILPSGFPVVTVSLKEPLTFGVKNLHLTADKSPLTQFRQILMALEETEADVIYFCEDDILYSPSHFDFVPPTNDAYYYNTNIWKLWMQEGMATYEDHYKPLSGLVANYNLMLGHYQRRVAKVLQNQVDTLLKGGRVYGEGYSKHMGYEPGGHMAPRGVDSYPMVEWQASVPLIDIRHGHNLTKGKRRPTDYHEPEKITGWVESFEIPGWGKVSDIVKTL